ncbi:MAG: hypothetical protein JRH16_16840 [Deltaproteobacteria bacterium]|nr:hypothetical protein [Deltaproteobacteria bacterium]MBW2362052.1 hypothetical protein [Deltaproteobacteria bacterium]
MMEAKHHRLWLALAFCWFLVLPTFLPTSVVPFVYPYVLAWALHLQNSPTARRLPLWLVGGSAAAIFTAVAALGAWPINAAILLTVAAIFISLGIAKALGACGDALETAAQFRMNKPGADRKTSTPVTVVFTPSSSAPAATGTR